MPDVYVVRNQEGQYLTKKGEWCSGKEHNLVFHKPNHDEALNQLIEANAKDITLRGRVESLVFEERRLHIVEYGPEPCQPELIEDAAESSAPSADNGSQSVNPEF